MRAGKYSVPNLEIYGSVSVTDVMVYVQRLHVLIFFGRLNFWILLHQPLHAHLLAEKDKVNIFEWRRALRLQSCFTSDHKLQGLFSELSLVWCLFLCDPLSGDISAEQFNPITESWIFP